MTRRQLWERRRNFSRCSFFGADRGGNDSEIHRFRIGMVIIAIMSGVIRDAVYGKPLGDLRAHQISTFTLIILSGLYLWLLGLTWNITSPGQAITIGLIWLALTVAFEFLFGHYVMKHPWTRLLHDYNILKGRIWVLVLIWITIAPYVFYKFRS